MRYGTHEKELFGGEAETTNNRMELTAVIEGLKSLKRRCQVVICTDSQYVKNGMESWIHGWKKNGWKPPPKNRLKTTIYGKSWIVWFNNTMSDGRG